MMPNRKVRLAVAISCIMLAALLAAPTFAQMTAPSTIKTHAVIDAVPNPAGVGEDVLIRFGILMQTPNVAFGYSGLTLTITKPDGSVETLGPYQTDSTGGTGILYKPTQAGTYKIKVNFPQQVWTFGDFYNREGLFTILNGTTLLASSAEMELTVHQEPSKLYPGHPLPTEYWGRPIDPQLREWATISGNWVARPFNSLADYNEDAPETAHVLWAKPLTTGGLTGGYWGDGQVPASSETGDAYEGKFPNAVIMNGILYYTRTDTRMEQAPAIIGIDLHTGEEVFFKNNTALAFGQILYFNSFNYDGVFTYLVQTVGSTYNFYDPFTGNWQFSFTNVPSGTRVFGPSGEILIYQIDYTNGWMALWNSTAAGHSHLGAMGPDYGSWGNSVHGRTITANVSRAYSWNVSIPKGLTVTISPISGPSIKIYNDDRIVGLFFNWTTVRCWAINLKPGLRGQLIFDRTWTPPAEWNEGTNTLHYVGATNNVEKGVIAIWNKELRRHYGFSVETGNFMWETASEHWLDAYGWGNAEHTWYFAYGKLYSVGVAGILYAYDDQTGKTVWTYELSDEYGEPVTGNNWWGWITLIADKKLYVGHLEHSAEQPLPRGAPFVCLDADTGEVIWRVNGMFRATRWGGNAVIGDSIIATMDTYDQRVYAIGKGPSKTTVEASPEIATHGSKILVKGMITDISPGTKDPILTMRFPHGVPAVADESMSDWMLYVYKQFECPANVKGVEVIIEVLDPNNNYYEVGRTTTDGTGFYKLTFTPPVPGEYTIIARFAGSKAYYGSYAETAVFIAEAPPPTPEATPAPQAPVETYFAISTIAIIVAIAVVGVLLLRKK
ncbi:MAG: hypothetical protein QW674_01400 [Candidatus Bathyarchaeia archaeon]